MDSILGKYILTIAFLASLSSCASAQAEVTPAICSQTLLGVMNGGRCFWRHPATSTWTGAWALCAGYGYGAVLAQIQTESEFVTLKSYIATFNPSSYNGYWIALQRDANAIVTSCAITNNTTYWYDSVTQRNMNLWAGNTWIRNHSCEDSTVGNGNFIRFVRSSSGRFYFGDITDVVNFKVDYNTYPLCMAVTTSQTYNQVPGVCLTENAVMAYNASQANDCANTCSTQKWCRSFNYGTTDPACIGYYCQLFSFTSNGNPPTGRSAAITNCVNYAYQP